MMYAVTVLFRIRPADVTRFMKLMIENAEASRLEAGCRQFDVCRGEVQNEVFLYEIYDDRAAFDVHLGTPHFKEFDAAVADMTIEKVVRLFDEVHA